MGQEQNNILSTDKMNLRYRDLFVNYCNIDGFRIVRVLSSKTYFAIEQNVEIDDNTVIRKITEKEIRELHSKPLSSEDIKKKKQGKLSKMEYILDPMVETMARVHISEMSANKNNGVSHDDEKIAEWFINATKSEIPYIMLYKGIFHAEGRLFVQDDAEALRCFEKAAQAGVVEAMDILSTMYRNGIGVEQNMELTLYWQNKAINEATPKDMSHLCKLYSDNSRIAQDPAKVVYWLKKSAKAGDSTAMNLLGRRYKNGDGVDQNLIKAAYWYMMGLCRTIINTIFLAFILAVMYIYGYLSMILRSPNS